ncbi:unnamed protein product [Blepharisma stoltei]|uniref:Uncharacterized protein n=1 Tax=Blepharisma stoltei TaxID=1481888 RepID=A0AAU9JQ50_9CILI|nr:unnamed protein product [Blepharisma stoltei]
MKDTHMVHFDWFLTKSHIQFLCNSALKIIFPSELTAIPVGCAKQFKSNGFSTKSFKSAAKILPISEAIVLSLRGLLSVKYK